MTDLIPSISYSQHDILRWINELHLDGKWISCDPCYGKGSFYKPDDIPTPRYIYDIKPSSPAVISANCLDLPFVDNDPMVQSIIFDPPFLQTTGKGSIIKERFGSYPTMLKLHYMYVRSIAEFSRVLYPGGILIVKMMNTVMSGKQWWNVNVIERSCRNNRFTKIDEFVLLAKHRMRQHNLKKQRHARKFHSYFLVYRKSK